MARSTRRQSKGSNGGHGVYDDVMSIAGTLLRSQKDFGASKINSLADATREFAAAMPEMPALRVYVDSAADRLDELSDYVVSTEFDDMIGDAGRLARRHPMATLGIAIAAGLGASQFMHMPSLSSGRGVTRATGRRRATASRGRAKKRSGRAAANG